MIAKFAGPHRFLSNFFTEPDGTCVEREFQQSKCADPADKKRFMGLTPGQCKRLGRKVKLRADWEDCKEFVMYQLVRTKFQDHAALRLMLLGTLDQEIVEGNDWGDTYWGVCDGEGQNILGKILMIVRDELAT